MIDYNYIGKGATSNTEAASPVVIKNQLIYGSRKLNNQS
tara:strand:+ start:467 stop:583 length:117 start_codon:yes stop_codon:yes gene_type:complete